MSHNFHANLQSFITLFALLASLCALTFASLQIQSPWLAIAALVYYAALLVYVIRIFPAAFILMLWFVFIRLTMMISGIAIENGGYMPEILLKGEPTGAFARLDVIYTIGILSLALILHYGIKLFKPPNPVSLEQKGREGGWWINILLAGIALIALCALGIGFKNGFPLFTGIDRMLYWTTLDNRFLFFFLGNRAIMALFLGLIFAITRGRTRMLTVLLGVALLGISFLFAEKFTSIAVMIFSFITPIFLLNARHQKALITRLLPLGLCIACLTVPAILLVYGFFEDKQAAIERFEERATSQAQLWFYADQNTAELFRLDTPRITHNLKAMFSLKPEELSEIPPYHGAKDFMAQTMEPERYAHYKERGVTLTMAMEAYLLKLFGWFGMIPAYIAILTIHAAYLLYLYFGIITVNPLRLVLAYKLLVWSNYGLNQGYIWSVFGLKSMLLLAFIIILELTLRMMLTRTPMMRRTA